MLRRDENMESLYAPKWGLTFLTKRCIAIREALGYDVARTSFTHSLHGDRRYYLWPAETKCRPSVVYTPANVFEGKRFPCEFSCDIFLEVQMRGLFGTIQSVHSNPLSITENIHRACIYNYPNYGNTSIYPDLSQNRRTNILLALLFESE